MGVNLGDGGSGWANRKGGPASRDRHPLGLRQAGRGLRVRTKGHRPLPCRPRPPPRLFSADGSYVGEWPGAGTCRPRPVPEPTLCAATPSRRPSVWVPSGQSCPPPSCALCFWLMHQPDSLKQNHLLSRQDPLFLSWHQMELLRRQRSFLSPEGVEMAPQATYVHTSLVGFRDEVNRASPLKTAQMTRGDAGAHLTESSAKYS